MLRLRVPGLGARVLQLDVRGDDVALGHHHGRRGQREALAHPLRGVLHRAVGAQHALRVRDARGLVARAAALEVGLEGDGRVGDVRGGLERRQPVARERRQLVPDEVQLQGERAGRLALLGRVGQHVVVRVGVPPAADRPLRDASPRSALLHGGGVHPGLLVEVADDAGRLEVRQALAHEVVVRGLIVREEVGGHGARRLEERPGAGVAAGSEADEAGRETCGGEGPAGGR